MKTLHSLERIEQRNPEVKEKKGEILQTFESDKEDLNLRFQKLDKVYSKNIPILYDYEKDKNVITEKRSLDQTKEKLTTETQTLRSKFDQYKNLILEYNNKKSTLKKLESEFNSAEKLKADPANAQLANSLKNKINEVEGELTRIGDPGSYEINTKMGKINTEIGVLEKSVSETQVILYEKTKTYKDAVISGYKKYSEDFEAKIKLIQDGTNAEYTTKEATLNELASQLSNQRGDINNTIETIEEPGSRAEAKSQEKIIDSFANNEKITTQISNGMKQLIAYKFYANRISLRQFDPYINMMDGLQKVYGEIGGIYQELENTYSIQTNWFNTESDRLLSGSASEAKVSTVLKKKYHEYKLKLTGSNDNNETMKDEPIVSYRKKIESTNKNTSDLAKKLRISKTYNESSFDREVANSYIQIYKFMSSYNQKNFQVYDERIKTATSENSDLLAGPEAEGSYQYLKAIENKAEENYRKGGKTDQLQIERIEAKSKRDEVGGDNGEGGTIGLNKAIINGNEPFAKKYKSEVEKFNKLSESANGTSVTCDALAQCNVLDLQGLDRESLQPIGKNLEEHTANNAELEGLNLPDYKSLEQSQVLTSSQVTETFKSFNQKVDPEKLKGTKNETKKE